MIKILILSIFRLLFFNNFIFSQINNFDFKIYLLINILKTTNYVLLHYKILFIKICLNNFVQLVVLKIIFFKLNLSHKVNIFY
ncbi:Hypothetical protein, predicted transmembrane protein [Metamycoplasma alkalescens 14918]|uniref:Uncharacterized protein n=1 Tax=Metamycoplasma alkalescens 14918 TaxID=1188234 RepID=N9SRW6_9BACT|nr:Hypothetical protein, predicted transmembrane protein [Metamycoplasma alkalescens 14918]